MDPARIARLAEKTDLAALLDRLEGMSAADLDKLIGPGRSGGDGLAPLATGSASGGVAGRTPRPRRTTTSTACSTASSRTTSSARAA